VTDWKAHIIRRRTTTFYDTVTKLVAKFRWCLSGTPIQNRLEDIGSLFAFIRAHPFDRIAEFRRWIALPFEQGHSRERASHRLTQLIDSTCLRRTRGLLHLPNQRERVQYLDFSAEEKAQYKRTKLQMSRRMYRADAFSRKGDTFGQFHVQLQLRIFCNHGTFQDPFSWLRHDQRSEREDLFYLRNGQGHKEAKCSLCRQWLPYLTRDQIYRTVTKRCAHVLCEPCLELQLEHGAQTRGLPVCPVCVRIPHGATSSNRLTPPSSQDSDHYFLPKGISTKMNALMEDLLEGLFETKRYISKRHTMTSADQDSQHCLLLLDQNTRLGSTTLGNGPDLLWQNRRRQLCCQSPGDAQRIREFRESSSPHNDNRDGSLWVSISKLL
jgi:SWI/SNF-related matrix-associated actin-dependent regulator of chromatin subfamily A3